MVIEPDICADCGAEGQLSEWCHYCGEPLCDDCARPAGFAVCLECEEAEENEEE